MTREEIESLNRPVANSKTESAIKSHLSKKKNPGPDSFTAEFYKTFKELILIPYKSLQKPEEDGILSNTFYKASITLISKPEKNTTKNKTTGQYP
jgi:hypothetical protein